MRPCEVEEEAHASEFDDGRLDRGCQHPVLGLRDVARHLEAQPGFRARFIRLFTSVLLLPSMSRRLVDVAAAT